MYANTGVVEGLNKTAMENCVLNTIAFCRFDCEIVRESKLAQMHDQHRLLKFGNSTVNKRFEPLFNQFSTQFISLVISISIKIF